MRPILGSLLPSAERSFGDYELVSKLAVGGMAEVFLARRNADGELVVVKRILKSLEGQPRFVAMFRDEARVASQIDHPNVCRVFEAGDVDGEAFIAMEYLHGIPLSRVLVRAARTNVPVDLSVAVGIVMQCAQGLHGAHELRSDDGVLLDVVHRDVSPPNILVTTDGTTKMLDFGVAKAKGATQRTRSGTVKGKNSYMSPEQIIGDPVDRRSDIFSLGIVLWEALASKRLFNRESEFATLTAISKADIPELKELRPEASDALLAVLRTALARNRNERYFTAEEFHAALLATPEGVGARQEAIGDYVETVFGSELGTREELARSVAAQLAGADLAPRPDHGEEETLDVRVALPRPAGASRMPSLVLIGVVLSAVAIASVFVARML